MPEDQYGPADQYGFSGSIRDFRINTGFQDQYGFSDCGSLRVFWIHTGFQTEDQHGFSGSIRVFRLRINTGFQDQYGFSESIRVFRPRIDTSLKLGGGQPVAGREHPVDGVGEEEQEAESVEAQRLS